MYNLMIVGIVTELCNHHHNPILEHFHHPKKKKKEKQDPLAIIPHSHTLL